MNRIPFVVLLGCLGLASCVDFSQDAPEKQRFLLAARRAKSATAKAGAPVLVLRTFAIAPASAGRALVVKTGPQTFASDYFHEFFVPPADAVTAVVERWFLDSGLFTAVVHPGSPLPARWRLEGDVREFHVDTSATGKPHAVVALQAYLCDDRDSVAPVKLARSLAATSPAASASAEDLVRALDAALATCLTELEREVAATVEPGNSRQERG